MKFTGFYEVNPPADGELEADLERERLARRVVDRALHALTRHEGMA
jgi:hypothetical protein